MPTTEEAAEQWKARVLTEEAIMSVSSVVAGETPCVDTELAAVVLSYRREPYTDYIAEHVESLERALQWPLS